MLIKIKVNTLAARKGAVPLNTDPIPSPDIAAATFIQVPTGGVTAPTARPVINTAPN